VYCDNAKLMLPGIVSPQDYTGGCPRGLCHVTACNLNVTAVTCISYLRCMLLSKEWVYLSEYQLDYPVYLPG